MCTDVVSDVIPVRNESQKECKMFICLFWIPNAKKKEKRKKKITELTKQEMLKNGNVRYKGVRLATLINHSAVQLKIKTEDYSASLGWILISTGSTLGLLRTLPELVPEFSRLNITTTSLKNHLEQRLWIIQGEQKEVTQQLEKMGTLSKLYQKKKKKKKEHF